MLAGVWQLAGLADLQRPAPWVENRQFGGAGRQQNCRTHFHGGAVMCLRKAGNNHGVCPKEGQGETDLDWCCEVQMGWATGACNSVLLNCGLTSWVHFSVVEWREIYDLIVDSCRRFPNNENGYCGYSQ